MLPTSKVQETYSPLYYYYKTAINIRKNGVSTGEILLILQQKEQCTSPPTRGVLSYNFHFLGKPPFLGNVTAYQRETLLLLEVDK